MNSKPTSKKFLTTLCLALLLASGCNQDFDPRGALDKKMVVFSVLSSDRDMQFVRVQTDYMPEGYDPLGSVADHSLNNVSVRITEYGRFYELRDTLVWTSDTTRAKFPIRTFFLDSFTPLRGRAYRVVVHSPSYRELNVGVIVPDRARISLAAGSSEILDRPDKIPVGTFLNYLVQMSKDAKGYIARFYVYYDVLKQNDWFEEAVEVPIASANSDNSAITSPRYPRMMPASSTSQMNIVYRNAYYKWAVDEVNKKYSSTQVIFKWIVLVVLQADQNLYEYYVSTHVEQDPYSTRLDEPLGSRAGTGVGLVGAYGLDSLVYLLPYDFWGNR